MNIPRPAAVLLVAVLAASGLVSATAGDDDAVVLEVGAYHEYDLSGYPEAEPFLEGIERVAVSHRFSRESAPKTPPPPNAATSTDATGLPGEIVLENGSLRLRSHTLGIDQTLRGPNTGFYHNGSFDAGAFFGEADVHMNKELRVMLAYYKAKSKGFLPEEAAPAHDLGFMVLEGGVDQLPNLYYRINTTRAGVVLHLAEQDERFVVSGPAYEQPNRTTEQPAADEPSLPGDEVEPAPLQPSSTEPPTSSQHAVPRPVTTATQTSLLGAAADARLSSVVAGAAVAAFLLMLALYSLFRPKDLLQSDMRQRILELIRSNPGVSVAQLARRLDVKHQTISYHLRLLKKAGYIVDLERGNQRLNFINGTGFTEQGRELLAAAQDSLSRTILRIIHENPNILKKDVAQLAGLSRTAGVWHINKLVRLGIVSQTKRHGHCLLRVRGAQYEELLALLHEGNREASPSAVSSPPAESGTSRWPASRPS